MPDEDIMDYEENIKEQSEDLNLIENIDGFEEGKLELMKKNKSM